MTLSEYKESFYARWQKRILRYCWVIVLVHFFATTFLNIGLLAAKIFDIPTFWTHTAFRSLLPMLIQIMNLIPSQLFVLKTNFSSKNKNRIVVFTFFWIMTVMAFIQSKYSLFLFFPAIPMFLAAVLTEKKMLNIIFASSLILLPFTIATWALVYSNGFSSHHVVAGVSLVSIIILIYFISLEILNAQNSLISYMQQTYEKQEELSEEIQIEPLTKLYNRKALETTVEILIDIFNKDNFEIEKNSAALIFLDLDNFKQINDKFGHTAGDNVLIALSTAIQKVLLTKRNAFRYGGDEFVLILRNTNVEECSRVVTQIMEQFSILSKEKLSDEASCTMSIGISFYKKDMTFKDWFKEADEAAYNAKQNGKNQFVINS